MNIFRIVFLIMVLLLSGCGAETDGGDDIQFTNPLIETDDFFAGSNWNDPHVIHDGSQFIMYASAAQNLDMNIKIYRLVSDDGINWSLNPASAVFEKSSDGEAWDRKSVETPAVVYYGGQYHLFYTGYPVTHTDSGSYQIGHATSPDGITWNRDMTFELKPNDPDEVNPNFPLDFMQWVAAEPAPVVFNNKIYLYFSAVGANETVMSNLQVIGLTTFDGSTWTAPELALVPDQTLYPRAGDAYMGYSTPNAIVIDGKVHLYFDVVELPWRQVKLHHAVSSDGRIGWTQDSAPLLEREDFSWTEEEIRSPSALYYNNRLYLYFAGHTDYNLAIGLKIY